MSTLNPFVLAELAATAEHIKDIKDEEADPMDHVETASLSSEDSSQTLLNKETQQVLDDLEMLRRDLEANSRHPSTADVAVQTNFLRQPTTPPTPPRPHQRHPSHQRYEDLQKDTYTSDTANPPRPARPGFLGTGSMTGTVKSFNAWRGFGFLVNTDGKDIFIHRSRMVDGSTPQVGDTIRFDMGPNQSKPGLMQAVNATGGTYYDYDKGDKDDKHDCDTHAWGHDCWYDYHGHDYGAYKNSWRTGGYGNNKHSPYGKDKGKGV
jgi:cold shock CspA family protein